MDILFEAFISTGLAEALCVIGTMLAVGFGLAFFVFLIEEEGKHPAILVSFASIAVIGIILAVYGANIPKIRQVYALPEEGFCYIDYMDDFNLVEQKGRILIMNSKD